MHEEVERLIPELSKWNGGDGIDLLSWVGCVGRLDHAIAYAAWFWPDFVMYDGCLFLQQMPDPGTYSDWMKACDGDRTRMESVMNHRHLADMFGDETFEPTRAAVEHLGRVLADMWQCKLRRDFPELRARVTLAGLDAGDEWDPEITVYLERA